jgi:hypothetical protein
MCDKLQTWCQIQRTTSSLRNVSCGPGHIQRVYSSAYSRFNIQMNVSAQILEICPQVNGPYTANIVQNAAQILQITLCELWSRSYTRYLQLRIFTLQYSTEGTLRWFWWYCDNSMRAILQSWWQIQRTSSSLRNVNCGPDHILCNYSTAYSCVNIRLNVSALPLLIYRQFNVRYTANMVRNTAHVLQIELSQLRSRTYTMNLQLHIFRLQY